MVFTASTILYAKLRIIVKCFDKNLIWLLSKSCYKCVANVLYTNDRYVLHGVNMTGSNTIVTVKSKSSYGADVLPNLVSIRDLMIQYMERKTRLQESAASVL